MNKLLYIFILSTLFSACNRDDENKGVIVAKAYNYTLYNSDLESLIHDNTSEEDSILISSNYINQWVHHHTILHKAVNNNPLSDNSIEIEKQVDDYRKSLIIFQYEKLLIDQQLDTIVNYDEIESFYNSNKKEFTLKDDIVQVAFLKFPLNSKNLKQVRKMMKQYSEDDIIRINNIASENASNYLLEEDTWILFDDLLKEIPLQTYNKSLYLRNNKYIEVQDSIYTYMLRINEYRIRNNVSPISFEYDRIKSIIINIRKIKLLDRMRKDVFEEAQKKGKVKIYNLKEKDDKK